VRWWDEVTDSRFGPLASFISCHYLLKRTRRRRCKYDTIYEMFDCWRRVLSASTVAMHYFERGSSVFSRFKYSTQLVVARVSDSDRFGRLQHHHATSRCRQFQM